MNKKDNSPNANRGCLIAIIVVVLLIVWKCNEPTEEEIKAEKEKIEQEKFELDFRREVDSLSKLPPSVKIANAYNELSSGSYNVENGITSFEVLQDELKNTNYSKRIAKTLDSLRKQKEILFEKKLLKEKKEDVLERKKYQTTLRNSFLDNGLDIEVLVYGKDNTKIRLTYVLFNDVWFRKFQTEGHINSLQLKGFYRIELTDGYDYKRYVSY